MLLRRTLLAAVAGVVLSLAYPPVGIFWLLPLAVAAYVALVQDLRPRQAWLPGLAFGIGFCYVLMLWMQAVDLYAWLALSGLEAAFYGLLGAAVPVLRRLPAWPVWVAVAWSAMEVLRSTWPFSGMPWGRLSFAVVDTPVAPALAYVGGTGVSLLLALVGALVAALVVRGASRRTLGVAGLVAAAAALLLPAVWPWQPSPEGTVRVAAVQGDVPGDGTNVLDDYRQVTLNHVRATVQLADDVEAGLEPKPDFVLWPENSTAVDPFADSQTHNGIETAVSAIGVPILVGAMVDAGPEHVMNQGVVWDPQLGAGDRYTKRHPVPFGEYIPWRNVFGDSFGKLDMIPRDMLSGTRDEPLVVAGVPVADAICFDIAYDDGLYEQVTHGAEMAVVQTSNAMFIHTAQIEQQFEISRARAIEFGRPLAIASVNGISGVIDAEGHVLTQADPRTTAVLEADVSLDRSITPGTYVGHWVGRLTGLLTVLALAVAVLGYRRRAPGRPRDVASDDHEPDLVPTRSPA